MRPSIRAAAIVVVTTVLGAGAFAQQQADGEPDDVRTLVGRLDLELYKATLKGLTQFGERRQGTTRNRDAIDWIEAQLKSVGCTTTERLDYDSTRHLALLVVDDLRPVRSTPPEALRWVAGSGATVQDLAARRSSAIERAPA